MRLVAMRTYVIEDTKRLLRPTREALDGCALRELSGYALTRIFALHGADLAQNRSGAFKLAFGHSARAKRWDTHCGGDSVLLTFGRCKSCARLHQHNCSHECGLMKCERPIRLSTSAALRLPDEPVARFASPSTGFNAIDRRGLLPLAQSRRHLRARMPRLVATHLSDTTRG